MFITVSNFLLLAMVNLLTILRARWKISAWIDKWTIAISINEQILQNMIVQLDEYFTIFMNAATDKRVLQ